MITGYPRLFHESNDQQYDHHAVETSNPVRPPPAEVGEVSSILGMRKSPTHVVRATRKPNAKGDMNGDRMKPIVHMFNYISPEHLISHCIF